MTRAGRPGTAPERPTKEFGARPKQFQRLARSPPFREALNILSLNLLVPRGGRADRNWSPVSNAYEGSPCVRGMDLLFKTLAQHPSTRVQNCQSVAPHDPGWFSHVM